VRYLGWIVAALAALIIIAFSVANRGVVAVSFAPLPFGLEIPLFAIALGALALGLVAGVIAKSLVISPHRRIARERLHRIRALEREVAALRRERAAATPASPSTLPSRPAPTSRNAA